MSDSEPGPAVRIHHDGGNVTITLARPDLRNALSLEGMRALTAAIVEHGGASHTRSIILTGEGAFCAGANLRDVVERRNMPTATRRAAVKDIAQTLIRTLIDAPVPLFAAIDGPAVGLGFDLALACDDLLFGPDGWAMQGWGRIGAIPGTGGELLLRRRNPGLLWRLLAEQPRIDGRLAERWGIGEAVADGTALQVARQRALALTSLPRQAVTAYVSLSRDALRRDLTRHLALCARVQPRLLSDRGIVGRVDAILGDPTHPGTAVPGLETGA
jgi:2-(1,2-epoxy-1,2-dihydrophenyl)acetyl-CoA isomerase